MEFIIAVALGLIGIAFVFAYLSCSIDRRHGVMQFLFLSLTMIMLVLLSALLIQFPNIKTISDEYTNTTTNITQTNVTYEIPSSVSNPLTAGYSVLLWSFILTLGYFIVFFAYQVLVNMGRIKKRKMKVEF